MVNEKIFLCQIFREQKINWLKNQKVPLKQV